MGREGEGERMFEKEKVMYLSFTFTFVDHLDFYLFTLKKPL